MRIYIGWSGERSKKVGKIFNEMLSYFNHESEPFFSPDIGKGSQWLSKITEELRESAIGIFCLTRENLNAPWILFEAGALSKGLLENHVCTFLLDLKTSDLTEPLSQFQWTINTKDEIFRLIETINSNAKIPLTEKVLSENFNKWYPTFEEKLKGIPPYKESVKKGLPPPREEGEILEEMLGILRDMKREQPILPVSGALTVKHPREPRFGKLIVSIDPEKLSSIISALLPMKDVFGVSEIDEYNIGIVLSNPMSPPFIEKVKKLPGVNAVMYSPE